MTSAPQPAGDRSADGNQTRRPAATTGALMTALAREVEAEGLTPAALARSVVQVLPVDGAAMSVLTNVLRLPLGASSDPARRAEELQTSLGEGPCLDAAEAQAAVVADLDHIQARWELYGEELLAQTPYRSVAAIPLVAPGHGIFAALDLYTISPRLSDRLDPNHLGQIPSVVAALLSSCVTQIHDIDTPDTGPDWYQTAAGRRHNVWIAIGMIRATRPGRTSDALSRLRAHAYTTNRSLDNLAADIIDGRLPLTDLTD